MPSIKIWFVTLCNSWPFTYRNKKPKRCALVTFDAMCLMLSLQREMALQRILMKPLTLTKAYSSHILGEKSWGTRNVLCLTRQRPFPISVYSNSSSVLCLLSHPGVFDLQLGICVQWPLAFAWRVSIVLVWVCSCLLAHIGPQRRRRRSGEQCVYCPRWHSHLR